jgi:hypothetical protein
MVLLGPFAEGLPGLQSQKRQQGLFGKKFGLSHFTPGEESIEKGQKLVAHTCNSSYSGGRDQEDHSLKPAMDK